jgi:hypothetical protein
MSSFITEWYVKEFSNTVYQVSQQKDSRLAQYARQESQSSKMKAFDRIGDTDVEEKTTRHGDTPRIDTPHSRRNVILKDFHWADLIDDTDKMRTLNDPTNPYVLAAKAAFNRKKDQVFYDAAIGTALTGENGDSTATFATTQMIAAVNGGAFSGLNIATLKAIKQKFWQNEAVDDMAGEKIHMAIDSYGLNDLLSTTEIASTDYNTVKALALGNLNEFMGIVFHRVELRNGKKGVLSTEAAAVTYNLTTGAYGAGSSALGGTKYIAWVESGMIHSVGQDITARISERDDKCYSVQPYVKMSTGAVRMEEEKVVMITVKRS